MKLTICQFSKLFLLLTAFFFTSKSFQTVVVAAAAVVGNVDGVVVEAVERDIERKFQPTQGQSKLPTVPKQQLRQHPRIDDKSVINNTFNSSYANITTQIENVQVSHGKNQKAAIATATTKPSATLKTTAKPLSVSLTDVGYNDVDAIDPKASTSASSSSKTTPTTAPVATSLASLSASAHVTDLMRGHNVGTGFLLQQEKHKRNQYTKQQTKPETESQTQPRQHQYHHHQHQQQEQEQQPQSPAQLQQPSYSSLTATSSLLSPVTTTATSLFFQSQYNKQQAQQQQQPPQQPPNNNSPNHLRRLRPRRQQHSHPVPEQQPLVAATTTTTANNKAHNERVGIVMPSHLLHRMHVQQGFDNFVEFFQVNLNNVSVDFIPDDGDDLTTFIKLLEQPNYTTVVKTLNAGINLDDDDDNDDLLEGVVAKPTQPQQDHNINTDNSKARDPFKPHKNGQMNVADDADNNDDDDAQQHYEDLSNETEQSQHSSNNEQQQYQNIAYCHLAKALERDFNKTVLLWPCPHMKESSNFLPSYEAISFAVKSIATKLNWTQVDIFVGDENWALPMAIAANMHIPYKIQIGEDDIRDLNAQDNFGKAIIITAGMNDDSTLRLLSLLESLIHTKVLLIDIVATSFNAENRFYKYLTRINPDSALMSNLLLLTVLSDNYRHFLNVAFDDNGIELVQNFRQQRRWKDEGHPITPPDWPIHLDKSVTKVLLHMRNQNATNAEMATDVAEDLDTAAAAVTSKLQTFNELFVGCPLLNESKLNLNELCQNYKQCWQYNNVTATMPNAAASLTQLCRKRKDEHLVENLRSFIDYFNFYDFIIGNILPGKTKTPAAPATTTTTTSTTTAKTTSFKPLINESKHVPKYDFIVLDVVRTEDATSHISGMATDTSKNPQSAINNNKNNSISGNQQDLNKTISFVANSSSSNTSSSSSSSSSMHGSSNMESLSATSATFATMPAAGNRMRSVAAFKWRPLLILEQHEINLKTYITHSIQPAYDDWLLVSTAQLWQCGSICWTFIAICAVVLIIIVVASVAAGIAMRNYLLRKRLSKGPNKIVLSANDFVFPVDSRRVDEGIEAMLCCWLQQLQEFGGPEVDKPDLLKGSIGSLKNLGFLIPGATGPTNATGLNGKTGSGSASLARHNPALLDMRARYNGDLVQLKEVSLNGSTELKSKAMDLLVMAHGLRHENINPLIGWLADANRTAMVFDYCSRGSLQDVLIMDEIKLDWSFRLSLLTDLVRGMRYLHTSPLRVHGTLTSRNCVVDARWVLKITDYGLPQFCEAQGLQLAPRTAKEMLWCAPELLRSVKPQHHHHHNPSRVTGTQAGDVYSFGIIMQEVVVRGEPYCMLSLSADEIIAKIKKPPPLIRPSVSKGAAPPEAINIMRQCWAEQPEMRPDFNSVYERFKLLNHGRKVNFVDTMFQMLEKYSNNLEELIRERTDQLDIERKKTEQLLNRMLPNSVAEKLKMGLAVEPEEFSDVTIYFSDIVGFTTIAAHCTPVQVVDLLNDLYTIFDATINAYNVYKVETIGDAYMVVSGLPVRIPDHAEQIATMALDLLHQSGRFNVKHLPGVPLQLRIGLHTGPCCAGVVGLTMPRYCLFGDTVNTASRMESTGSSWRIHMSQETRSRLETRGGYMIEPRGLIDIKGKGMMNTFWLLGKKGFEKPLPNPPPIGESHGLDESLIRNSITQKAQANKSRNSTNPSSSQSSSLAGESVEVKVEITPPANIEVSSSNLPNSYSLDSNSTTTISPNMTLCPEFPTKTPNASPQARKITDLAADNLLNPNNFNRLPSSTAGSSSRLYKKLEEMMDLSLPYNHYKCLSPSESNLTQFYDGKYVYCAGSGQSNTNASNLLSNVARFEKPGSSRLLRRQFSLDRDDNHSKADHQHGQHHQSSLQSSHPMTSMSNKSSMLEIPILHDTSRSPKGTINRIHKQNSNSIAQDLEKIEEIPLSPASSQQHSSLDSNMNRSPPSTVEAPSPPATTSLRGMVGLLSSTSPPPTQLSAPASPAPSRSLNGAAYISAIMESPTTDASSTATTTASVNSSTTTAPNEDQSNVRKPEITLNVAALLSR